MATDSKEKESAAAAATAGSSPGDDTESPWIQPSDGGASAVIFRLFWIAVCLCAAIFIPILSDLENLTALPMAIVSLVLPSIIHLRCAYHGGLPPAAVAVGLAPGGGGGNTGGADKGDGGELAALVGEEGGGGEGGEGGEVGEGNKGGEAGLENVGRPLEGFFAVFVLVSRCVCAVIWMQLCRIMFYKLPSLHC